MKIFILNCLLFFNVAAFSQKNLKVTYAQITKNDTLEYHLISDGKNANYYNLPYKVFNQRKVKETGPMQAEIIEANNFTVSAQNHFFSLNNNIAYWQNMRLKDKIIVDSLPNIDWKIDYKDQKKIGTYLAIKATATYRGSDLVAYFTPEITHAFGPLKLKGLPGLILEVYTVENNPYRWVVKKIEYLKTEDLPNVLQPNLDGLKKISMREYRTNESKEREEKANLSALRITERGGKHTFASFRQGLEKVYEWEKN